MYLAFAQSLVPYLIGPCPQAEAAFHLSRLEIFCSSHETSLPKRVVWRQDRCAMSMVGNLFPEMEDADLGVGVKEQRSERSRAYVWFETGC